MQALIYHGPGQKQWESKSDPKIEDPTDAIVKIDTTTIATAAPCFQLRFQNGR